MNKSNSDTNIEIENPLTRFSNRVAYYVKYRPRYPPQILTLLKKTYNLKTTSIIADIGSGTGFLAELFLKNGNTVFGVEPNQDMRHTAEQLLKNYPKFHSVEGTAEKTTLTSNSVDFITCGQSFHWFDREKAKKEFQRILKNNGVVVIIWNDRKVQSPFSMDYERLLLKYGTDFTKVDHKRITDEILSDFYHPFSWKLDIFPNKQILDFDGLKGRLLSASYVPLPGHPNFNNMMQTLKEIFERHQKNGKIVFEYNCKVYHGRFK